MNVLLTCAGRRNYLVEYFREALAGRGQVFAADSSQDAPALQEADRAFLVPPVGAPTYFDTLVQLCQNQRVGLLISLNDLELPRLARQRERFLAVGAFSVVSRPEVVDICWDKWATLQFLKDCGLATPKTYLSLEEARKATRRGDLEFPVTVKPRWGTASIGIVYPENDEELQMAYQLTKARLPRTILSAASAADPEQSVLIQERLRGEEHGMDVINDLDGRHVCTFVKRKLAMRGGETDRAVTVDSPQLSALGKTIGERLGHVGNLDCDVFVCDNACHVLELNPRFGGGYPFSHVAGANLPAALIAWASGEAAEARWLTVKPGTRSAKCDRLVVGADTADISSYGPVGPDSLPGSSGDAASTAHS